MEHEVFAYEFKVHNKARLSHYCVFYREKWNTFSFFLLEKKSSSKFTLVNNVFTVILG